MPKIGLRLWKTGVAVAIAVLLARQLHMYEIYASLAAAVAVAPTARRSLRSVGAQVGVNLLAGLVGGLMISVLGTNPLVIAAGLVVALALSKRLGWSEFNSSLITATLFVMGPHPEKLQTYVLFRWLSVMLGCLIGVGVNAFILPPNHWQRALDALRRAGASLDPFMLRVADMLASPAELSKAEVLAEVAVVEKALEETRRVEVLAAESASDDQKAVFDRAAKVLSSMLERVQVVHRSALTASQAACEYHDVVPELQEALRELVDIRRTIYAALFQSPAPARLVAQLQKLEARFRTTAIPPEGIADVEEFFQYHQVRASVSYMANRLQHLNVAASGVLPPVPQREAAGASAPVAE
ncbi:MAG: putative rane protein [Firmicutes bacterium]|nr:putative rane protein [Bacillota bacterium]